VTHELPLSISAAHRQIHRLQHVLGITASLLAATLLFLLWSQYQLRGLRQDIARAKQLVEDQREYVRMSDQTLSVFVSREIAAMDDLWKTEQRLAHSEHVRGQLERQRTLLWPRYQGRVVVIGQ
jgi:hypothetical protein